MIFDRISEFISEYNMLVRGETVLCGLSGGADSVFLLLAMCEMRERLGISVRAIHVNHCLRGSESDRDENFCRQLCEKIGVDFKAVRCDVKKFALENSLSDEQAGRILRYRIFSENSVGGKIATAHNADDNLETVIFNLTRGTALRGICGIPPVRGNIIRPILAVTRAEIEDYLKSAGQNFVTDSTNLSDDYTRNKIRHRVIPILREINPSLNETAVRSIRNLRAENDFIEMWTDKAMKNCRKGDSLCGLKYYDEVIRHRCIARLLSEKGFPYSSERLQTADKILTEGGKLNISGNFHLISDGETVSLKEIVQQSREMLSKELVIGENVIFHDRVMKCEILSPEDFRNSQEISYEYVHKKLTFYLLDYDKIVGRAIVRNRRFGDRIKLPHRGFDSSVKKLINETVPKDMRAELHFIEDGEGTIFAECIGVAERVLPDAETERLLKITFGDWRG